MENRLRKLVNDHGSTPWDVSALGFTVEIAAGGGELDVTDVFSDADIATFLAASVITLTADNMLVVEDPDTTTKDITSNENFGVVTKQQITDYTNADHDHEDSVGGGQVVGANALSDYSEAGGANKVVGTDGSGNVVLSGGADKQVTGLSATPSGDNAAASKAYVDATAQGLDVHAPSIWATAAALDSYTADGHEVGKTLTADGNGALTIDGQAVSADERVLVKNEGASHVDHGIYTCTQTGDAGTPWILTRATDFDEDDEVSCGAYTFIEEGDVNGSTSWVLTTTGAIEIDVTAITFEKFSGTGQITAGVGMTKAGDTLNVGDGVVETRGGIDFTADDIAVKPASDGGIEVDSGDDELQIKKDVTTGVTVAPLELGANGAGVKVDDTTIEHTAGELSIKSCPATGQKEILPVFSKDLAVADDTYLRLNGIPSNTASLRIIRNGKITGISAQCGTAPGTSIDFEVHKNGAIPDATCKVSLTGGASGNQKNSGIVNSDFDAGDLLSVYANDLVGTKPEDVVVTVEFELD